MLAGTGVPIQKRYVVDGQQFYYRNATHPGSPIKDVVQVYYQFKHDLRGRIRDHAAEPQGRARHGGGERTDRRHMADAAVVARVDEDRGVRRAIQRARGGRRDRGAEVSRARDVLT